MSLAEILQSSFTRGSYDLLFTSSKGFLNYDENNKRWYITKAQPRDPSSYYSEFIDRFVKLQSFDEIPEITLLVQRINGLWQQARGEDLFSVQNTSERYIYFNSHHKNFRCFSNFYPTLTVFSDPLNHGLTRVYPSSENAYQAHKTVKIRQDLLSQAKHARTSLEMYGMPSDDEEFTEMLCQISTVDPAESRALSKFSVEKTDELAKYKASIMKEILRQKFLCNQQLYQCLKATKSLPIIEDTSDPFWGAKHPLDSELTRSYRLPITQRSRNVVGRILIEIRNEQ